MTRPTKRQRQAKCQRATGRKTFDTGFIQDPLEVTTDPNYLPESDVDGLSDTDSTRSSEISFTFLDESGIEDEPDNSDSNEDSTQDSGSDSGSNLDLARKRMRTGAEETRDYVEQHAHHAAAVAHKIWLGIEHVVCIINYEIVD